jgi:hypothetical protein
MEIATKYVRIVGTDVVGTRTIESGNPIMVIGIYVAKTDANAQTSTFTDKDGTSIMTIVNGGADTVDALDPWMAYNGLIVPATGATVITTIHYRPGV